MGSTRYKHQPVRRVGQEYSGSLLQPILTAMDRELLRLQEIADIVSDGGFAPSDAQFVTLANDATLTSERVLSVTGAGISLTDAGANSTVTIDLDADLDAIAALAGTSGILAKTAADTWALRTLTAPAAGITIANPAGVLGDPTFALADDLAGLEGLGTTGLAQRTGTSTWATVTDSSTVGQVLRVTGAATYGWGALDLSDTDAITGDLPFSRLAQITGCAVLGVATTGSLDDVAAITCGTDHQTLRRSGSSIAFGALNLAQSAAVTGTLDETNGGTGNATWAQGDLIYGSASDTLTALAKNTTATRYLSNTGASNNPAWAQVDLTNGVTGELPAANIGDHDHSSSSQGGSTLAPTAATSATVPLTVNAIAGQTANLFEVYNSDYFASPLSYIVSNGNFHFAYGPTPERNVEFSAGQINLTSDIWGIGLFRFRTDPATFNVVLTPPASVTADRTVYIPNASGTLLMWTPGTNGLQPAAGSIVYGVGTTSALTSLTIGASGTILTSSGSAPQWSTNAAVVDVARTWATLQKFPDDKFNIVGSADPTKIFRFEVDGITTATTRTWTVPDFNDTFVGTTNDQTITAQKTFAQVAGVGTIFSADAVAGETYLVFLDESSAFTSSWIGPATGFTADRTLTVPDADGTIVLTAGAQTIGSKTFSSTNVLVSNSASAGVSFADTTTDTKRLRMVLSTAVGNNSFALRNTAARTYTFLDQDGGVATDGSIVCTDDEVVVYEDEVVLLY